MRYRHFDPAAVGAVVAPTQEDLLTQIESDHSAERHRGNDPEVLKDLDARYQAVASAGDDEGARKAYNDALAEPDALPGSADGAAS